MHQDVTTYIEDAPKEQRDIMRLIRSLLHESVADVVEEFKWSRPVFSKGKGFAYFQANKGHVSIGFTRHFEKLNDPNGLLEGTGKTMRHVKIKSVSDIDADRLKDWFVMASST